MWKDVIGYEGLYQVDDTGNVRSLDRIIISKKGSPLSFKGQNLKISTDRGGYKYLKLCNSGFCKKYKVHRLVAFSFIGDCTGLQINHKNGIKSDNRISNLEICDSTHNNRHALEMGLKKVKKGSECGSSILIESQVLEIEEILRKSKTQIKDIASTYNVSPTTIGDINKGRSWQHLTKNTPIRTRKGTQ